MTVMNNYKYNTKRHCDNKYRTIADQNYHTLNNITETSALGYSIPMEYFVYTELSLICISYM